jgi:DNA-binding transcriptional regulator YhcF (GntR family)
MEFREKEAIYLQIAEYVCHQILMKKWKLGERIPSIRELAIAMEVNPNTVQRTYDSLQQKEIISNRRGIGYFVEENAEEKILAFRRDQFVNNELPVFFRNLYLLKLDLEDIQKQYEKFIKKNFKNG